MNATPRSFTIYLTINGKTSILCSMRELTANGPVVMKTPASDETPVAATFDQVVESYVLSKIPGATLVMG